MEWQADYAAGEFLMPADEVEKVLDGLKPPATLSTSGPIKKRFRDHFDASQAMMELRLKYLGYKLVNTAYEWADSEPEKRRQEQQDTHRMLEEFRKTRKERKDNEASAKDSTPSVG